MDISAASEWSSGCESGWTVYLDESSLSPTTQYQRGSGKAVNYHQQSYKANGDEEDEEDLSMISDASSGPRHFRHDADVEVDCCRRSQLCYPPSTGKKKKKKKKGKELGGKIQQSFLDDTASSPANTYPNRFIDPSNNHPSSTDKFYGFSDGNEYMGNPAFGFWQSSPQDPAEPSRSQGRRRG